LQGLVQVDYPVIFPLHPGITKMIPRFGLAHFFNAQGIRFPGPVGYPQRLVLEEKAVTILTDSG